MEQENIGKIWFEIKNISPLFWGYDGMEGLKNDYDINHLAEDGYVKISNVLVILEKYLK